MMMVGDPSTAKSQVYNFYSNLSNINFVVIEGGHEKNLESRTHLRGDSFLFLSLTPSNNNKKNSS